MEENSKLKEENIYFLSESTKNYNENFNENFIQNKKPKESIHKTLILDKIKFRKANSNKEKLYLMEIVKELLSPKTQNTFNEKEVLKKLYEYVSIFPHLNHILWTCPGVAYFFFNTTFQLLNSFSTKNFFCSSSLSYYLNFILIFQSMVKERKNIKEILQCKWVISLKV